ncbi:hypothetical protein A0H81_05215 [Grifola frondosa]|uniref:Uncharacterized protein n=1 Tax=Grifola frondosa TaxID=5627 RepID=A0A1C7MBR2_GRIFR|nr:hypothetical protein A0H81_05215 [Grifola frondosa]
MSRHSLSCIVKERFLSDEEIIEHLVDNATSTVLWTIHRPKRGWYIRLRTPFFPPGVFISLEPLPSSSPYYAEAALAFACRTNALRSLTQHPSDSEATLTNGSRDSVVHSYPPTPPPQGPAVVVQPPSPHSVLAKLDEISLSSAPRLSRPKTTITHFLLTPLSAVQPAEQVSLFSRVISIIKNHAPAKSYSFTLSPVPPPTPALSADQSPVPVPPLAPLLTFYDSTPVWTFRCNSGVIEIDEDRARALGVQPSFYVAVALTYLEFMSERESYLAAAYD